MVDASVAAAWCLDDNREAYSLAALRSLTAGGIVVPHVWGLEIANVLLIAERRGRISSDDVNQARANLLSLPITIDPVAQDRALMAVHRIARLHGLTAYDGAYLELAIRLDLPIATLNASLTVAAESEGVVRWRPE